MGTDPFNADFSDWFACKPGDPRVVSGMPHTILPACRRTCPGPSHGRVGDRQPFPHMRATCVRGSHECHQRGLGAVARIGVPRWTVDRLRSEEHTSELQSLMRISYAVFCLKKKK